MTERQSKKMVNKEDLEGKVKEVYRAVALNPQMQYHFEMGEKLAKKLGYLSSELAKIPPEAVESFAGVGYHFGFADIREGEHVLDLGSGSGMDVFLAALKAGKTGKVVGVDMTDEQLKKAEELRAHSEFTTVSFHKGYIEKLPFKDESFDVVISNGVINLSAEKQKVFQEVYRVLKPSGRLAISDIVSEKDMPESITCDANLWASCIGGASQLDQYQATMESSGLRLIQMRANSQYQFLSASAQGASQQYGVKSISLLAQKS